MKDAVCRLCLAVVDPDDSGSSVLNDRFRQALEVVFTFKIRVAEDLPVHTCKQCSWNVLDFRSYSELVKTNQETLEKRLPHNVQNKSTTGEDTAATGVVFNDDINEENLANEADALNSSQLSDENHPLYANTTPIDDVKVAYEIHPDHESSTTAEEDVDKLCSNMICEDYVINPTKTEENSSYTTMETTVEKIILQTRERFVEQNGNDLSDTTYEPAQKRKKLSTSENASAREYIIASDPYNASSNVHKEAVHVLNEQPNEMHPCEQCERKFASKWELEYHKQEHMFLKCPFCRITLSAKMLNVHVTTHQDAWSCKKCKKKFINSRDFIQHRNGCTKYSQDHA